MSAKVSAIILSGGSGRRLGGVDKASLLLGKSTLLESVLLALDCASEILVVGPPHPVSDPRVRFCREEPPGGGPVAAISAAISHTSHPLIALASVDTPFLGNTFSQLITAIQDDDAVVASDGMNESYLIALFQRKALLVGLSALSSPINASMKMLLSHISYRPVVIGEVGALLDIDTPADLALAILRMERK